MKEFNYINKPIPRIEGMDLSMGKSVYMDDFAPKECLILKLIHSPYPSAEVEEFNDTIAEKVPGVVKIYSWKDSPRQYTQGFEYAVKEHHLFQKTARFEGDVVGMVVAKNEKAASKAASLVKIKWKKKQPLTDMEESYGNEQLVHEDQILKITEHRDPNRELKSDDYLPEKNQIRAFEYEQGNVDEMRKQCSSVVSVHTRTARQMHSMLETHRCYAEIDSRGMLVIQAPMQSVHAIAGSVAIMLGIDKRKIRTVKAQVGGGFGGKNVMGPYMYPAFATWNLKCPTKLVMSRTESMAATGTRHEYVLDMELGADENGIMHYLKSEGLMNGGAYAEFSDEVLGTGIHNTYPIFPRIEAVIINQKAVYSNNVMGCAFRGFGATQNSFALNCAVRHLADDLHMDISELMLKNIAQIGDSTPLMNGYRDDDPAVIGSCALEACIRDAKKMIDWEGRHNKSLPEGNLVRGIGMGISAHASGVPRDDRCSVNITFNPDGSFTVYTGHSDIGTGSNTTMLQIVAETLDVPMEYVHLLAANSQYTPFDNGTYASSNVYRCCGAAKDAADKMVDLLINNAKEYLKMDSEDKLFLKKEQFIDEKGNVCLSLCEFAGRMVSYADGRSQIVATGTFADDFAPSPYVASCAEVEIDKETGFCRVIRLVSAVDCGQVINSNNAKVQVQGGLVQSLGMTLFEEVQYGAQHELLSKDYESYKIPCQMDIPEMEILFEDSIEPTGPFGAKSVGEIATGSPAPAICDAIFNATGVHVDEIPVTPERLLKAIRLKER